MDHNYSAYIAERSKIKEGANCISCSAPAIANNCCFYTSSIFASETKYTRNSPAKLRPRKCSGVIRGSAQETEDVREYAARWAHGILIAIPFAPVFLLFSRPSPRGGGLFYDLTISLKSQ